VTKKRATLLLKLTLVGGFLYFLSLKGFFSVKATSQALLRWKLILPAAALLTLSSLIGVMRWWLLLQSQGIRLTFFRALQFSFTGYFFNIALPGAVSGDLIKAYYVGKEFTGKRAGAFSSILFDRICGVSGLFMISLGGMTFTYWFPLGEVFPAGMKMALLVAGAGIFCFYFYLFQVRESWDPLLKGLKKVSQRLSWAGAILRVYEGIRVYGTRRRDVVIALGLSLAIFLLVVEAFELFAGALEIREIPMLAFFILVPLGLLFTAVPILPAGVGTGHAAFSFLFIALGSPRGADVFNLMVLFQVFQGLIGSLFYLALKARVPVAPELQDELMNHELTSPLSKESP